MITEHKFDHEADDEIAACGLSEERMNLFLSSMEAASNALSGSFRASEIAEKTLFALPDDITPAELFLVGLMAGLHLAELKVEE